MKSEAEELERIAELKGNHVVGGPLQEAILSGGKVTYLPPDGLRSVQPMGETSMFFGLNLRDSLIPFFSVPQIGRMVLANVNCDNATIILDRTVLIGGTYNNCRFITTGQEFFIDLQTVKVQNGTLMLGLPNMTDQAMDSILCRMPGIDSWTGLPTRWGINGEEPSKLELHPVQNRCKVPQ